MSTVTAIAAAVAAQPRCKMYRQPADPLVEVLHTSTGVEGVFEDGVRIRVLADGSAYAQPAAGEQWETDADIVALGQALLDQPDQEWWTDPGTAKQPATITGQVEDGREVLVITAGKLYPGAGLVTQRHYVDADTLLPIRAVAMHRGKQLMNLRWEWTGLADVTRPTE